MRPGPSYLARIAWDSLGPGERAVDDAFSQIGVHARDRLAGFGRMNLLDAWGVHGTGHGHLVPEFFRDCMQVTPRGA
jgi:hypothetical protein